MNYFAEALLIPSRRHACSCASVHGRLTCGTLPAPKSCGTRGLYWTRQAVYWNGWKGDFDMPKAAKKFDATIQRILKALESRYGVHHPKAKIEAYRYNPASIRIRIIDPDFAHKGLVEREEMVWPILEELPEDILSQL